MPLFDECCVLLPATTLEDFPSEMSDYDGRSLLAAWTLLWHPSLLADCGQLPTWYRADAPPDALDNRLFAVPEPSQSWLPDGLAVRAADCPTCQWITGASRTEMLGQLPIDRLPQAPEHSPGTKSPGTKSLGSKSLGSGGRTVQVEDFFAAGYAFLQIQVMTRRLRYTSNIDEIHLQNRVVAAAQAFIAGDADTAADSLHDVFDCLAEERDHYFSSDPHLIDLVLTSPSTLDGLLEWLDGPEILARVAASEQTVGPDSPTRDGGAGGPASGLASSPHLAAPLNVLIDGEVAAAIGGLDSARTTRLKQLLASGAIGWAGGGPPASACLDTMTYSQAESVFESVHRQTADTLGSAPTVYGRFSGATPSEMTATLVRLGYCGMIPIDFAGGSGFGDEAKVILQAAGSQLEALTAKPIDASQDASFLTLGTRLGESIDSGEIATALLAHWPGQTCDAFEDLKRVATWSLCLGRFWNLADYFQKGEHPYHHGTASSSSPRSAELLASMVSDGTADPLSEPANAFRQALLDEQQAMFAGMRELVIGPSESQTSNSADSKDEASKGADSKGDGQNESSPAGDSSVELASAIGAPVCDAASQSRSTLLINSHSIGCRRNVTLAASLPRKSDHLFAATIESGQAVATVDVPSCGFVLIRDDAGRGAQAGIAGRIREMLMGGPRSIAESGHLQNEFMEVALSDESGGISGVYSGAIRGNRFSFRLVHVSANGEEAIMHCDRMEVIQSTPSQGCIEATGTIRAGSGPDSDRLAAFKLRYTLHRGSRFLQVEGEIDPASPVAGSPWNHHYAARVAVASETPICRALVRDKAHRATSRRMVAPLGIVIDEAERQTLVCGSGLAFHRRVGDRFLDTLLLVQGEREPAFKIHYGFDVSSPVASARAMIAPPLALPVQAAESTPEIGWMVHASPKDLLVSQMEVQTRSDGRLAAVLRIIQTQPQSCKAKLRFFRDVELALLVKDQPESLLDQTLEELGKAYEVEQNEVACEGDQVSLSIPSHAVADLLVLFVA